MALFNRHPKDARFSYKSNKQTENISHGKFVFSCLTAITYYLISLLNLYDKTGEYRYLYSFCDLVFECKEIDMLVIRIVAGDISLINL